MIPDNRLQNRPGIRANKGMKVGEASRIHLVQPYPTAPVQRFVCRIQNLQHSFQRHWVYSANSSFRVKHDTGQNNVSHTLGRPPRMKEMKREVCNVVTV